MIKYKKGDLIMESKLSPMEYKFMEFIWKHPNGVYSNEIYEVFPQTLGTKGAVLFHIKEKGFVSMQQKGKQTLYIPLISKREYDKAIVEKQMKKKFGNSKLENLIATLCGKEKLTSKQVDKLYDLIEELKEDNDE